MTDRAPYYHKGHKLTIDDDGVFRTLVHISRLATWKAST